MQTRAGSKRSFSRVPFPGSRTPRPGREEGGVSDLGSQNLIQPAGNHSRHSRTPRKGFAFSRWAPPAFPTPPWAAPRIPNPPGLQVRPHLSRAHRDTPSHPLPELRDPFWPCPLGRWPPLAGLRGRGAAVPPPGREQRDVRAPFSRPLNGGFFVALPGLIAPSGDGQYEPLFPPQQHLTGPGAEKRPLCARAEGGRDRHGRAGGRKSAGTPKPFVNVAMGRARRMPRAWRVVKSPRMGVERRLKGVLDDGGVVCGTQRAWKITPESHERPAPLILMEY